MSKVSMMGTISCPPGIGDEMEAVLRSMVDTASEEPWVEIYSYHHGEGDHFLCRIAATGDCHVATFVL